MLSPVKVVIFQSNKFWPVIRLTALMGSKIAARHIIEVSGSIRILIFSGLLLSVNIFIRKMITNVRIRVNRIFYTRHNL